MGESFNGQRAHTGLVLELSHVSLPATALDTCRTEEKMGNEALLFHLICLVALQGFFNLFFDLVSHMIDMQLILLG